MQRVAGRSIAQKYEISISNHFEGFCEISVGGKCPIFENKLAFGRRRFAVTVKPVS